MPFVDRIAMDSVFSGEEAFGKHLDLYYAHSLYLNLKGISRLSYIGYLDMLRAGQVERNLDTRERSTPAYVTYLETLYDYLTGFFNRALPLINIQDKLKQEEENFATSWEAGQVGGWGEAKTKAASTSGQAIWCGYCAWRNIMWRDKTTDLQVKNIMPSRQFTMPT